ncbi:hypothetical protein J2X68_002921 [Streptomyces sp. 3330]|uniref:hypothetical protein n=1 Tax=Streptomyces sp. 3330 TaxID=2817755 RepID=UPI0028642F42|nr:hypothetical protein [Streptomyces sp. 3330]MDR6976233.1 hypothetical protein [Streptomyces sp. 3330]
MSVRKALLGLGVRVVESPDEREHFVVVEGEGEEFEVVRPAYIDQATSKVILSGQLRRVPRRHTQPADGTGTQDAATKEDQP